MSEELETKIVRNIVLSLHSGDDLIPIIKKVCIEKGIKGAFVSAIGSGDRIPIAIFNKKTGKYDEILKTGYHEVISINGNVSTILDNDNNFIDLLVHLHIAFADRSGRVLGGHLLPGFSTSTVLEVLIKEIDGGFYRHQSEISNKGFANIKFNTPTKNNS
jgi:predicted DNA-binding protein with PD1-like motif